MNRVLALALVLGAFATGSLRADSVCPDTTPYGGNATGCGVLIDITDNGSGGLNFAVTTPGNGNPYDGADDTLVGVENNTKATTINSITLSSSTDIFGFDADGMCTYYALGAIGTNSCGADTGATVAGGSGAGGIDPLDYSGDAVTLTCTECSGNTAGIAAFNGGLAAGATQFFSLEENIVGNVGAGGSFTVGSGTPEPGTTALLLGGFGALLVARRRLARK